MNEDEKPRTAKDTHYAKLRRAHRERQGGSAGAKAILPTEPPSGLVRIYGIHAVRAALDNPARKITRMLVTRNAAERLGISDITTLPFTSDIVEPRAIDRLTGGDAVHQGVLVEARPLRPKALDRLGETRLVVVLDQLTDPHNVGAVMRSAVAFGAGALVTTARHSPQESGVLAKAASGALEQIDVIEVRNLADALAKLQAAGFQTIGLDSEGPTELEQALTGPKVALVLGSEGKGLRHKTREMVSTLARLAMPGAIRSLNVSNAAAVALYAARRHLGPPAAEPQPRA